MHQHSQHNQHGYIHRLGDRQVGALDRQAVLLLAVQGLFAAAHALSGTFVPVYLFKASQSLLLIGWYTLFQYVVAGGTFWVAGRWVKTRNKMNSLRLGVVLSGLFYWVVLLLGSSAIHYAVLLGVLNGMASGFFWVAYNVIYFEITEPDNRDRFNGVAGLLGSGAGIVAPWLSGLLITSFADDLGYRIIFTVSLAVFGLGAVISFFLHKRKAEGHYEWLYGLRQLKDKDKPWRRIFAALLAQGVREGVFLFLIGLLIYMATESEAKIGAYSLWTSLVSLVAFWLIGKSMKIGARKRAMGVGVFMLGFFILPLFWQIEYWTLLVFGIGTAVFFPLYTIPMTSTVFDLIGASQENVSKREEFVVLRELGLVAGRLLGIAVYLIVLSWSQSPTVLTWLMLGVGLTPIAAWWFIRHLLVRGRLVQLTKGRC